MTSKASDIALRVKRLDFTERIQTTTYVADSIQSHNRPHTKLPQVGPPDEVRTRGLTDFPQEWTDSSSSSGSSESSESSLSSTP